MKTIECKGNAYECGYSRGIQLKQLDLFRPEFYRFGVQKKRIKYSLQCQEIYEQYDPSLIAQLQGFCDALGASYEEISTFLFGMYAFDTEVKCSCVAMKIKGEAYLGRNSDFLKLIQPYCIHESVQEMDGYAYVGNTTAFLEIEDGMNEHGLAVGLTFVRSNVIQPGFTAGFLVRYLLAHCKSVAEAIQALESLPIGSAQTLTMVDALGNMAVVECNCEKVSVHFPDQAGYAVNHFHHEDMQSYVLTEKLEDLHSETRWQTLQNACAQPIHHKEELLDLLRGKYGFLCQYPKECPADTVWSVLYQTSTKSILQCDGNPSRQPFVYLNSL